MYKSVNKIANQVNFLALAIQALLVFKFGVKCQQKPNVLECVSAVFLFTMRHNLFVCSYSSNPLYQMCCVCSCFVYISKSFNGFFMFFKLLILTWVYISVVLDDLCPSNSCIYLKSVPLSSK